MAKVYKPNWSWLLIAAMTFFPSCSDDDHLPTDDIDPEPTEEELAELAAADRLEAANYVIRAFAGLDALPDNWETSTFTPQEGVVVDEATPGVRYVIVENQDAADQYFRNITPDEHREENGNSYQLSVEGFGSLTYQRTATATCFGVVKVNLTQMPSLTEIRLVPESEVPTNAKFDGTPYYGIGSIVKDNKTGYIYICVRPSGGPNRKEYAYFVTFDPRAIQTTVKSQDLYEIDENGKKTKKLASTSGNWVFAKNLVEKRIAFFAGNYFQELNKNYTSKPLIREIYDKYTEKGLTIPLYSSYFVPYGGYKSTSAKGQRQVKYEQPGLFWGKVEQLGLANPNQTKVVSYVSLRPDAKAHLLTLTDDYDPSYYYNLSKARKDDPVIRWDANNGVGYNGPFSILDYTLEKFNTNYKLYYPLLERWGKDHPTPVLVMTQKKITDKGQKYKDFEDLFIVDNNTIVDEDLETNIYQYILYDPHYEITDGRLGLESLKINFLNTNPDA